MHLLSPLLSSSKGFSLKAKLILFRFAYYILNITSIKLRNTDWAGISQVGRVSKSDNTI